MERFTSHDNFTVTENVKNSATFKSQILFKGEKYNKKLDIEISNSFN